MCLLETTPEKTTELNKAMDNERDHFFQYVFGSKCNKKFNSMVDSSNQKCFWIMLMFAFSLIFRFSIKILIDYFDQTMVFI